MGWLGWGWRGWGHGEGRGRAPHFLLLVFPILRTAEGGRGALLLLFPSGVRQRGYVCAASHGHRGNLAAPRLATGGPAPPRRKARNETQPASMKKNTLSHARYPTAAAPFTPPPPADDPPSAALVKLSPHPHAAAALGLAKEKAEVRPSSV